MATNLYDYSWRDGGFVVFPSTFGGAIRSGYICTGCVFCDNEYCVYEDSIVRKEFTDFHAEICDGFLLEEDAQELGYFGGTFDEELAKSLYEMVYMDYDCVYIDDDGNVDAINMGNYENLDDIEYMETADFVEIVEERIKKEECGTAVEVKTPSVWSKKVEYLSITEGVGTQTNTSIEIRV
jgi:hypothetical protein